MADALHAVNEAESLIRSRAHQREGKQIDFRHAEALEVIADEMTRLSAEVRTLRYLFSTYASRPTR